MRNKIHVSKLDHSTVDLTVIQDSTIVNRQNFEITREWFERLLSITYDNEIKSKYIPELHQLNDFERSQLKDILCFNDWKEIYIKQIDLCLNNIEWFKTEFENFFEAIKSESISITNSQHPFISKIHYSNSKLDEITNILKLLRTKFDKSGYEILSEKDRLTYIPVKITEINYNLSFKKDDWRDFLDKDPSNYYDIMSLFHNHHALLYNLHDLNVAIEYLQTNASCKIIVGDAGTGKTHVAGHLINRIRINSDLVIFLKAKQFNGDNVNFSERILQLLLVPSNYTLSEILEKLNNFCIAKNRRCFFLIDALNETTKFSIGFSTIWKIHLSSFINQVNLYSHLYFIATLRTSYIDQIWSIRPLEIVQLKGFTNIRDTKEACKKYFAYYKITAKNFDTVDLNYFKVPLLLDLFCKLTNGKRKDQKEITLDIHTYLQIFKDYIDELISEVKEKLNLQKFKPITSGFAESSLKFWGNNEAVISLDEFTDAFDKDDYISQDNSIARAVLEGYLIFIKDVVAKNTEIVKHTQQEVGGYLLAKKISDDFPFIEDLINSQYFKEKIIVDDTSKHHQLRLDILKFLIALRPELIKHLTDKDGIRLSWWYLYNGYSCNPDVSIEEYLLTENASTSIIADVLDVSSSYWFNPISRLNFSFIAPILDKLDIWEFEAEWTFYIYKEADFFYEFVDDHIRKIKEMEQPNPEYLKIVAKFLSYVTSTNIRELRDLVTIYLIEFGKKFPLSLLELTEHAATLKDGYIYERLVSSCYGVALNLQNNEQYVNEHLPFIAQRLYDLQFAGNPKASTYNYLVIDAIKHFIDFALFKNVIDLSDEEKKRVANYEYIPPHDWIPPSDEQSQIINESNYMSYPDPINMDFGIYTIPRLIHEREINDREAISNVYKRIFELGYKSLERSDFNDERFRDFYWGNNIYGFEGKVDRLGKKYDWKAFFDYAGFLLLNKKLNVFEQNGSLEKYYERLSDVDIDICIPNQSYKLKERLYLENLLPEELFVGWQKENKIDSLKPFFTSRFQDQAFTMLYGKIDQRLDDSYDVRSFLLAESFFIKKNDDLSKILGICNQVLDWDLEVRFIPTDKLRHVYFGELYWADNIPEYELENISIPTGNLITKTKKVNYQDTWNDDFSKEDIGKEIQKTHPEKIVFESEASVSEYLWESNSKILSGYSEYYPSIRMGKSLCLKAEPSKGKILDNEMNDCFHCVEFEDENHFSNSFNYMRTDLIKRYMSDNNLALVYQIKQHSYDMHREHSRLMKFYIINE